MRQRLTSYATAASRIADSEASIIYISFIHGLYTILRYASLANLASSFS